jgi:hypothetical protein
MPELRVVESGICGTWRGFGRWVERFGGFRLPLGYGVVLGFEMQGFCRLDREFLRLKNDGFRVNVQGGWMASSGERRFR